MLLQTAVYIQILGLRAEGLDFREESFADSLDLVHPRQNLHGMPQH